MHDGNQNLYEYNADGLRTKKTVVSDDTYRYYYSGDKLVSMVWEAGEKSLNFLYNGDAPYSMVYYDGTYSSSYFYLTDLQGDVVALMSAHHGIVAEYTYDAWGNILAVTDSLGNDISGDAAHIANLNPIRYRGYFYDIETGFYYLQSRYYDPAVGRFINGDAYASTGTGFLGYNMYTYCLNNPVMFSDFTGTEPEPIWKQLGFEYANNSSDFIRLERGEAPAEFESWLNSGMPKEINITKPVNDYINKTIMRAAYYPRSSTSDVYISKHKVETNLIETGVSIISGLIPHPVAKIISGALTAFSFLSGLSKYSDSQNFLKAKSKSSGILELRVCYSGPRSIPVKTTIYMPWDGNSEMNIW